MLDKPLFVDNQLINITGSIGLASARSTAATRRP